MIAAGLLAKKAVEKGLRTPPFVKTSLAPGSRAVTAYLKNANLLEPLETLGFHVAGYGCMTCIGNSGPLSAEVERAITEHNLTVAAVLSGNRNFEGRVHPLIKANYLASPPLVVAFALAGCMGIDWKTEPMGGTSVFLADIFPMEEEIAAAVEMSGALSPDTYKQCYENVFQANAAWNSIPTQPSKLFAWNPDSTYIQEPPFLEEKTADSSRRKRSSNVYRLSFICCRLPSAVCRLSRRSWRLRNDRSHFSGGLDQTGLACRKIFNRIGSSAKRF
jgi:aconitate hydratase